MTDVDLRAAARALLVGHRSAGWAMHPDAMARIAAIARAEGPIVADAPPLAADGVEAASRGRSSMTVRGSTAVIPLKGMITPTGSFLSMLFGDGPGGLRGFRLALREALGSDEISSIVLDVDSPGGLVDLVPETAAEVRNARAEKPIVAVSNTFAASAAYWIAAQADELVVTPSGEVGSIGVYSAHEDWSSFDEQMGVATTLIYAGRYKIEGNPFEPLSDEARAARQQVVDDLYSLFVEDVAAGRGVTADAVRSGYGEGRVVPAPRAVQAGLADRVATLEQVVGDLTRGPATGGRRASASREDDPSSDPTVAARLAELGELRPPVAL